LKTAYLRGKDLIDAIQQEDYSRDLIGYAGHPPHAQWPNQARIAVQFVLNYEEGGENHIEHGDAGSEQFLSEIVGAASFPAVHKSMDSMYEYGSRAGFWRIHAEFQKRQLPMSIFGVGMALARNPAVVEAIKTAEYDVVSHGQRWLHYQNINSGTESQHMDQALSVLKELFGKTPIGWYTGRDSPNTRQLLAEFPEVKYDCDYYGDDLPFWTQLTNAKGITRPHLIIPYTLECNDMKFSAPAGFNHAEQFFQYLKDSFDVLYAEGEYAPKMMSIGMHCRLLGRPGRFKALQKFLDYVQSHDQVWICTRQAIAEHWYKHHLPNGKAL
jgi:allantoinase